MVRQAPVICVMAPPIHLGAWSMALMLWLPFELLFVADPQVQCLQSLISAGCDLSLTDISEDSPLHIARTYGQRECQDLITEKLSECDSSTLT